MNYGITSVVKIKGKPRYRISLDSGDTFELSGDLVTLHSINPGATIDSAEYELILKKQSAIDAKIFAHNFVSYAPRTKKQVAQKMKEKGFSNEQISLAVSFLVEFDLINEQRYARSFIEAFLKKKPAGKQVIYFELLKKGIDKEMAADTLKQYFPDDVVALAVQSGEKKLRLLTNKDYDKKKQSLINFLKGRGFDWDTIKEAIAVLLPEK